MPRAVQRIDPPTLPLTVTLNDREAMMPAMKMSAFPRWVITARLTASGGAQALSGDLEGSHPVARADAGEPLDLVIDRQLPYRLRCQSRFTAGTPTCPPTTREQSDTPRCPHPP